MLSIVTKECGARGGRRRGGSECGEALALFVGEHDLAETGRERPARPDKYRN